MTNIRIKWCPRKASEPLIRQAIERTEREIADPWREAGFVGWRALNGHGTRGNWRRRTLANEARSRLQTLRALL